MKREPERCSRAKLRAGAILAALKNRKVVDLTVDPRAIGAQLPFGCTRVRLALGMVPDPRLRVSGMGLHADLRRDGMTHTVWIPWWSVTEWRAR